GSAARPSRRGARRAGRRAPAQSLMTTRALVLVALLLVLVTDATAARPWAWLGVRIRDLSEQEMDEISKAHGIGEGFGVLIVAALFGFFFRDPATAEGTALASTPIVAAVERRSVAERGGLRADDVVLQVDDHPVVSREAAREALADASPDRPLRLVVRRERER